MAALRLLEMERHALLMYTSCGWFFADISGLESLQVIKYAARALQLGQHFTAESLEPPFLKILERAVSNLPKEGNGLHHLPEAHQDHGGGLPQGGQPVGDFLASKTGHASAPAHIYHYRAEAMDLEEKPRLALIRRRAPAPDLGRLSPARATPWHSSPPIWEVTSTAPRCSSILLPRRFLTLRDEFFRVLESTPEDLIPLMVRRLGGDFYYGVHDIFQEEKLQVFQDLLRPNREEAAELVAHSFEEIRPLLKALATEGLPMPRLSHAPWGKSP